MSSNNDANSGVFSDRTLVQHQTLGGRVTSGTTHNEGINSDQSLSDGEMSEAGSKHSHDSLEEYKSAALHFYDPAMMVSYVYVSGKMVGYVKGAIYRKTTWVLALVAFPSETSGQGCWVLKGSYGGGDHRRDMISQVSECMTQNTQRGTSARSFRTVCEMERPSGIILTNRMIPERWLLDWTGLVQRRFSDRRDTSRREARRCWKVDVGFI